MSAVAAAAVIQSEREQRSAAGRFEAPRPCQAVIATQSARKIAAGMSAAWKTSCVFTIRALDATRCEASVCARIIASPSRISTSEGGTTTPSVLATHTSATLRSSG